MFRNFFINSPNIFFNAISAAEIHKNLIFQSRSLQGQKSKYKANSTKTSEKDKYLKKLMKKAETCFEKGKKRKVSL